MVTATNTQKSSTALIELGRKVKLAFILPTLAVKPSLRQLLKLTQISWHSADSLLSVPLGNLNQGTLFLFPKGSLATAAALPAWGFYASTRKGKGAWNRTIQPNINYAECDHANTTFHLQPHVVFQPHMMVNDKRTPSAHTSYITAESGMLNLRLKHYASAHRKTMANYW